MALSQAIQESALAGNVPMEALGEMARPEPTALEVILLQGDNPIAELGITATDTEDGGVSLDLGQPQGERGEPKFDDNLADWLDDTELEGIGSKVVEYVGEDKESRAEWETILTKGIEYLGVSMEERTYPFPGASGVYDPVLMEAVCRWQATASAELMPAQGPVKTQIIGVSSEESEQQAWRVREFMNLYLTDIAPEYIEENDQMLFWLPLVGSTFKKTYFDPVMERPVSRFILPENFIVPYQTTDLESCIRMTQVIPTSRRDLKMRQLSGFYRDIELGDPLGIDTSGSNIIKDKVDSVEGVRPNQISQDHEYTLFECHIDLDLEGFEHVVDEDGEEKETGLPLPYIVTIDRDSRKVLAIRRNWREGDPTFKKILYFTHFKFVPGLGFYGFGYAHLLGNSAKAATSLRRQMIDAETLAMFPGGLRVKGMRLTDNNLTVGPCEFAEIDTGGQPITSAIMTMPYKGASDVSLLLLKETYEAAKSLVGNTEIAVGEGRQDAPVGTTVALLEASLKLQSATIKRAHRAFRREFKLIATLFGQYLPDKPYPFPVQGGMEVIMRQDFSQNIDVLPISDPNIASFAQRMMRADAICNMAVQFPAIYDAYQANRQRLVEMGVDDARLNLILPPPNQVQPMDPLSENMNAVKGSPLAVGPEQDHEAHITAHAPLMEGQQPMPAMQAHIAEHTAWKMRNEVQRMLGIELPPPGTKLPPEVENQIAVLVAQAMQAIKTETTQGAPSPEAIAWEQVKVDAQKVAATLEKTKADLQSKAYAERLKFESSQRDRQNRIEIAQMQQRGEDRRAMQKAITDRHKATQQAQTARTKTRSVQ